MLAAAGLLVAGPVAGQTTANTSVVPRLVRFSGTATDARGNPAAGVAGVKFALYAEETGGAPLWMETQIVQTGPGGHYTVLLGATKPEGLPVELFASEQAHWLGVTVYAIILMDMGGNARVRRNPQHDGVETGVDGLLPERV
jgi:hypothetical protein